MISVASHDKNSYSDICTRCGLLRRMPGREECLYCITNARGDAKDAEAPGIGDS